MHRIPLTAPAECVDGPCGGLAGLVIRADSRTLEYYVVRDTTPGHPIERLVPRVRVLARRCIDGLVLWCARLLELRGATLDRVGRRSLVAELLARRTIASLAAIAAAAAAPAALAFTLACAFATLCLRIMRGVLLRFFIAQHLRAHHLAARLVLTRLVLVARLLTTSTAAGPAPIRSDA